MPFLHLFQIRQKTLVYIQNQVSNLAVNQKGSRVREDNPEVGFSELEFIVKQYRCDKLFLGFVETGSKSPNNHLNPEFHLLLVYFVKSEA